MVAVLSVAIVVAVEVASVSVLVVAVVAVVPMVTAAVAIAVVVTAVAASFQCHGRCPVPAWVPSVLHSSPGPQVAFYGVAAVPCTNLGLAH